MWFPDLESLIAKTKPAAVCAFNSIYEHLEVVEKCAPKGIHVMVEKPLAVNMDHLKKKQESCSEIPDSAINQFRNYLVFISCQGMENGQ